MRCPPMPTLRPMTSSVDADERADEPLRPSSGGADRSRAGERDEGVPTRPATSVGSDLPSSGGANRLRSGGHDHGASTRPPAAASVGTGHAFVERDGATAAGVRADGTGRTGGNAPDAGSADGPSPAPWSGETDAALAPGEAVVELRDVHKAFGSQQVLRGLGLSVARGEVFGFLGRNGAGKSTAIRILMGITRADYGRVRLFGRSLTEDVVDLRRRVGYVAQEQNVYPWMTPRTLARFVRGFYPRWDDALWRRLIDDFALPPKRRVGTFSGGMKARLALSLALATRPELLILDEPTAGMDPVARREFIDLVREHVARDGATTFFSTHLIDEIEAVADRIAIVEGGRTMYEGELAPLREALARFSIASADDVPGGLPGAFAQERLRVLEDRERSGRRYLTLQFSGTAPAPAALALESGWRAEPMTLEDVFIAIVAGRRTDPGVSPPPRGAPRRLRRRRA